MKVRQPLVEAGAEIAERGFWDKMNIKDVGE